MKLVRTLILILLAVLFPKSADAQEAVVDTTHQKYSYAEMMEDIVGLRDRYPQYMSYEMRDTTYQGRVIPLIYFGNPEASRHIMIQAAMHAREYMSSQLVMAMLEHYLCQMEVATYAGKKLKDIFADICLVILPMVNPDGVEIAQKGAAGAVTEDVRKWARAQFMEGNEYDQIKANARGVDVNRNFKTGFGQDKYAKPSRNFYYYPGIKPYSEVETRLLMKVAREHLYTCFVNYHSKGNLIYYGSNAGSDEVNGAALRLTNIIRRQTGFKPIPPDKSLENGSWADDLEVFFNRPSATIEIGSKNPVPIEEFQKIYRRNLWVWADLAVNLHTILPYGFSEKHIYPLAVVAKKINLKTIAKDMVYERNAEYGVAIKNITPEITKKKKKKKKK